jgi:hypothetical protein
LPASLEVLIPSTEKPVISVYTAYQNLWSYPQAQQNDKTRSATQRLPAQGVVADSAVSSFTDTHVQQDKKPVQNVLLHPLFIEGPINKLKRTTLPPNFRPIPMPEVLRPSKVIQLPSGLETTFSATAGKPTVEGFKAKYGLKPPSQLSNWLRERHNPINTGVQVDKSAFKRFSQFKTPTVAEMYGDSGQSDELDYQHYENKKIIALEVILALNK